MQLLILKLFQMAWDLWQNWNGLLHNELLPKENNVHNQLDSALLKDYSLGVHHALVPHQR
jgi:hypothetical protein